MYSEILLRAGRGMKTIVNNFNIPVSGLIMMHPANDLWTGSALMHEHDHGPPGNILVNFILKDGTLKQTKAREGENALRNTSHKHYYRSGKGVYIQKSPIPRGGGVLKIWGVEIKKIINKRPSFFIHLIPIT